MGDKLLYFYGFLVDFNGPLQATVAQLDQSSRLLPGGSGFESLLSHHQETAWLCRSLMVNRFDAKVWGFLGAITSRAVYAPCREGRTAPPGERVPGTKGGAVQGTKRS
jgi:hypothetical protein